MTTNTTERLAVIETKIQSLIDKLDTHIKSTNVKIKSLEENKADAKVVEEIKKKIDKANGYALISMLSIIGFLFSKVMGWI